MKPLNARQQAFVREYARCRNGSKAARRAGYNPDTAGRIAWQLLNEEKYKHVQAAAQALLDDSEGQRKHLHNLMTNFLVQTIEFDPGDCKDENDDWLPLEKLDPEDRKQISSIQDNKYQNEGGQEGRSLSVRFGNKLEAVKILGKHTGYFAAAESAGEAATYREAEAGLLSLLDRIGQRSAEPIPGSTNEGAAPGP